MISAIIPTYRNPAYLDLCLRSMVKGKKLPETEIIVVVDGFAEESEKVLKQYTGVSVISLPHNVGMQYALNVGVMNANTSLVFVANDDNVFPAEWDRRLYNSYNSLKYPSKSHGNWWMELEKQKFVLTANQIEPEEGSMFGFIHKDFGRYPSDFQLDNYLQFESSLRLRSDALPYTKTGNIFPFLIEKKWYMAVGGFDVFYSSPQVCDWDFFLKLQLIGLKSVRDNTISLYHFGSRSTKLGSEASKFKQRELDAMQTYFYKWGAPPYNEQGSNNKIPRDRKFRGFSV